MAPSGTITMTTILLCFVLGPLRPPPATCAKVSKECCTMYNRKAVPFTLIEGFREQTIKENCNTEAIIFYTVKKNKICATQRDGWVRKALEFLSSKLKKMSKTCSAAGDTLKKKRCHLSQKWLS